MAKRVSARTKSAVFEHFTVTTDGKYYQCQCALDDDGGEKVCDAKISSFTGSEKNAPSRASNLKRHLQRLHPKVLEAVLEKDETSIPSTSAKKDRKCTEEQTQVTQAQLSKFFTTDKITVTMTSEKFKRHIIEMVVKNSVPVSFFSQPAFLGLNGEMARKLGVSLERENIRKLVIAQAKGEKEELRNKLKERFVFIKMDGCTRHRVNYFAINVRFVENNKTFTRTLAVKDTQAHHTSEYLQKLVEEVLEDFKIQKEQVLCIVTDNASNMISTIEKMNEATEEGTQLQFIEEIHESTEDDPETAQPEESSGIQSIDDMIETTAKLFPIQHMRCAVHTLQLAIRDGLQDRHAATLISKLRQVAVAARTPKIDAILKRRAGKGAILDQATRWGSTYLMIKRLHELRSFLEDLDNERVSLTASQWEQVTQLESLLSHPFAVTKKLQAEDLTPGTFLLEWKRLIYQLNMTGGVIADGIVSSMKRREYVLLDNKILLAAVYIDPMNRILLDSAQTAKGKEALFEVATRMKELQARTEIHEPQPPQVKEARSTGSGNGHSDNSESASSDKELDFDSYLDNLEQTNVKRLQSEDVPDVKMRKFKRDFFDALKEVEKFDRSSKVTVDEAIPAYPEIISGVARTVTAMPPTQVSVERLFSALKIIRSDLRASMKEDLTEAILFLRTKI